MKLTLEKRGRPIVQCRQIEGPRLIIDRVPTQAPDQAQPRAKVTQIIVAVLVILVERAKLGILATVSQRRVIQ